MGNIVLLDDLTINKIAAGEVIERPANVVKELVENSIDAGAKNIVIEIKKGGKELIKVTDDGKGIAKDDMFISIERHATSKIRQIEDLEKTYTMGFRGEALASIAAISRLSITSKTEDESTGLRVICEGGDILSQEEVACKIGTIMEVNDLFFNTPVRYKFLKQDMTEFRYIKEWVEKASLVNTDISFKLINENKTVFRTSGSGKIEDVIYILYGRDIKDNIVKVDFKDGDIHIEGVIGNTLVAKDTRKDQIVFLNKRNIKSPLLSNSADQAFKGGTGIGKYGFFILNLEMPADYYDVNVHPAKLEVRFKDEDRIYKDFYHAIKSAVLDKAFLGNTVLEDDSKKEEYINSEFDFGSKNFKSNDDLISEPNNIKMHNNIRDIKITNNKYDYYEKEAINKKEKNNEAYDDSQELRMREKRDINYKYIGILFRTYIVIEIDNEIYLMDQHAAHERVLYEKVKENYKKQHTVHNTQLMIFSDIVNLTHKEMSFVEENMEMFRNVGFDIEKFGDNSIKINGIPDIEYKSNKKSMFLDVLDEMILNERSYIKDIEERFIATVACKAAVKAHMVLSKPEVDDLIKELLVLKDPYTCPHGRPTTVKISKEELIKKLGDNNI